MNDIEIACQVLSETDLAYRVYDGAITTWIPKSQITHMTECRGQIQSITIPEWLAREHRFI